MAVAKSPNAYVGATHASPGWGVRTAEVPLIGWGQDPGLSTRRRMRRPYIDRIGLCQSHNEGAMARQSSGLAVGATHGSPGWGVRMAEGRTMGCEKDPGRPTQ